MGIRVDVMGISVDVMYISVDVMGISVDVMGIIVDVMGTTSRMRDQPVMTCVMRRGQMWKRTRGVIMSHLQVPQGVWCDDCVTRAGPSWCVV